MADETERESQFLPGKGPENELDQIEALQEMILKQLTNTESENGALCNASDRDSSTDSNGFVDSYYTSKLASKGLVESRVSISKPQAGIGIYSPSGKHSFKETSKEPQSKEKLKQTPQSKRKLNYTPHQSSCSMLREPHVINNVVSPDTASKSLLVEKHAKHIEDLKSYYEGELNILKKQVYALQSQLDAKENTSQFTRPSAVMRETFSPSRSRLLDSSHFTHTPVVSPVKTYVTPNAYMRSPGKGTYRLVQSTLFRSEYEVMNIYVRVYMHTTHARARAHYCEILLYVLVISWRGE